MSFPVGSWNPTAPIARVVKVLGRSKVDKKIQHGGNFVCKKISGSSSWSQHSWGNAVDIFPTEGNVQDKLRDIANTTVFLATHRVKTNFFRKLNVAEVIDHDGRRMWTPGTGWTGYSGTMGPHIHITGAPKRTGTPPCA